MTSTTPDAAPAAEDATTEANATGQALPNAAPGKALSAAALRALAEAAERKAALDARAAELTQEREIDGRGGLEPVRYNDWEVKGIASDF
ncbi:MAG: DUF1674 domain-containing protein [Bosea sp. (in: a-proteobacteria)]|jgi:hypothetical protein